MERIILETDGGVKIPAMLNDTVAARDFKTRLPFTVSGFKSGTDFCCSAKSGKYDPKETQSGWKNGDISLAGGWFAVLYAGEETSQSYHDMMIIAHIDEADLEKVRALPDAVTFRVTLAEGGGESADSALPAGIRKISNIAYADEYPCQTLDLYLPEKSGAPLPLVMFIHGGGWFSGSKDDGQESKWLKLIPHGYAVASVEYRLTTQAPHPAGILDCKSALRALKGRADEFGLDKTRIAVSGESSGGHYALMTALTSGVAEYEVYDGKYKSEDTTVKACVAFFPAADIRAIYRDAQGSGWTGFGADFAIKNIERYYGKRITSLDDEIFDMSSPIHYLNEKIPSIYIEHGDRDSLCPIAQSIDFYNKARAFAGYRIKMDIIPGEEHAGPFFSTDENMERVRKFLDEAL